MAQITEKELSAISDLLTMEENLVQKYRAYACQTTDCSLKEQYEHLHGRNPGVSAVYV